MNYIENVINKAPTEHHNSKEMPTDVSSRDMVQTKVENANFTETYQAYVKSIYRFILFKTNSYYDAEDITAEVFYRYLRKGSGLKKQSVLPWLYVVAGNLCVSYYRNKRNGENIDGRPESCESGYYEPWENSEPWQLIKSLKPKEQQIIYLRAIEDKSFKKIALILNIKEGDVKMVFYRAASRLRSLLKEASND